MFDIEGTTLATNSVYFCLAVISLATVANANLRKPIHIR